MNDRPGGLGRLVAKDLRDLNHLMAAARPQVFNIPPERLPNVKHYTRSPILDQGMTGCCVAFSLTAKLRGLPVRINPPRGPEPFALYDRAIAVDEFTDNDHDTARQYGTSVRAGCKVLQGMGLIESYNWAYTVDDVLQWILSGQGGLVLGISWYSWMDQPTRDGVIRRPPGSSSTLEGGHAIYAYGADRKAGFIDLQNSWGVDWGGRLKINGERVDRGCCRLPLEELERLLNGNGEAVAIIERSVRRKAPVNGVSP